MKGVVKVVTLQTLYRRHSLFLFLTFTFGFDELVGSGDHIGSDIASYGVYLLETLLTPEQQRADLILGGCVNS